MTKGRKKRMEKKKKEEGKLYRKIQMGGELQAIVTKIPGRRSFKYVKVFLVL